MPKPTTTPPTVVQFFLHADGEKPITCGGTVISDNAEANLFIALSVMLKKLAEQPADDGAVKLTLTAEVKS